MLFKKESSELDCQNQGDLRKIYDATFDLLYKVSFRIVNDEEAAEDLVHDSFIKASEKHMIFPSVDDAKFWLICVTRNSSINYAKRTVREAKAYQRAVYEGRQHFDSGEVDALKKDSIQKVRQALNCLPQKLKDVLVLREYADMNYKEIGKALGISEGNVKVRVFRAREQLLKLLGEDDVYLP